MDIPIDTTKLKTYTKTVTTGALNDTFTPDASVKIYQITVHADGAVAEALTVTLDSKHGAGYDAKLLTLLAGWTDGFIEFGGNGLLLTKNGNDVALDKLVIACTNAGNADIGLVITYELL